MNIPELAAMLHAGQTRNDKVTPYTSHLAAVASNFEPNGFAWQVAWLHDSLEDTTVTAEQLLEVGVHEVVVEAVKLLTKDESQTYLEYIQRLLEAMGPAADIARRVKLADMGANLADAPNDRQRMKYAGAIQLFAKRATLSFFTAS